MTEQQLRELVRDAIAKAGVSAGRPDDRPRRPAGPPHALATGHGSHAMFTLPPGDPDGRCLIEPGVACNHCGYCKSYGH